MDMRSIAAVVGWLVICQAGPQVAASMVQDVEAAARLLVPLLGDVRNAIRPQVTVEPTQLPPSPFTGRSSTLFAVQIGFREQQVDESVVKVMDRLLAWDRKTPLSDEDRELVDNWLEELQPKVAGRLLAAGLPAACERACLIQRLRNPDSIFGKTAKEQQETRDDILLQAFIAAVPEGP